MEDTARPEAIMEVGETLGAGIVRVLRLFLGVEVIEVSEELVEAMDRGEVLVAVAQVVLAELTGGVPMRLEEIGDCRISVGEAFLRARGGRPWSIQYGWGIGR